MNKQRETRKRPEYNRPELKDITRPFTYLRSDGAKVIIPKPISK